MKARAAFPRRFRHNANRFLDHTNGFDWWNKAHVDLSSHFVQLTVEEVEEDGKQTRRRLVERNVVYSIREDLVIRRNICTAFSPAVQCT